MAQALADLFFLGFGFGFATNPSSFCWQEGWSKMTGNIIQLTFYIIQLKLLANQTLLEICFLRVLANYYVDWAILYQPPQISNFFSWRRRWISSCSSSSYLVPYLGVQYQPLHNVFACSSVLNRQTLLLFPAEFDSVLGWRFVRLNFFNLSFQILLFTGNGSKSLWRFLYAPSPLRKDRFNSSSWSFQSVSNSSTWWLVCWWAKF